MTQLRRNIPPGMTRVIGVDLFDGTDYLIGDFDDPHSAFEEADERNKGRCSSMDDVFYVYDEEGSYLRGPEALKT